MYRNYSQANYEGGKAMCGNGKPSFKTMKNEIRIEFFAYYIKSEITLFSNN